jgi:hypothetical protein
MKRFLLLHLLLTAFWAVSCRKPQDLPPLSQTLLSGTWKVQTMKDNGTNYTAQYNGWRLAFAADGNMSITTPGGGNYTGTWNENNAVRRVTFTINAPLLETARLSREWDIVLVNPTRIRLANDRFAPTQELVLDRL